MDIRQLRQNDFEKGILETLFNLTNVGLISKKDWLDFYKEYEKNHNHFIFVALFDEKIVGSITLLVESKIIHYCSRIGHIEDLAVREGHEGQGIAKNLIQNALDQARLSECKKVMLYCPENRELFYEKLEFHKSKLILMERIV